MDWGIEDLAATVALVGGAGIILALILTSAHSLRLKRFLAAVTILMLLLIWAHLSVGIF